MYGHELRTAESLLWHMADDREVVNHGSKGEKLAPVIDSTSL